MRKGLEIKTEVLDLSELFNKQSELDFMYMNKFEVTHGEVLPNITRALKSEFGEAQAKWGGFKYWSVKRKYSRDEVLEECVDMLHFYLSIGNFLGVPTEHTFIDQRNDQYKHLDAMDYSLLFVNEPMGWYLSFGLFRGMMMNWGFDWEKDVMRMYAIKNKINYKRQEEGY
jgi:dimeric dUTPase (all-alpha-NTP-PPase superfamily)